jgi:hypothetical protein
VRWRNRWSLSPDSVPSPEEVGCEGRGRREGRPTDAADPDAAEALKERAVGQREAEGRAAQLTSDIVKQAVMQALQPPQQGPAKQKESA